MNTNPSKSAEYTILRKATTPNPATKIAISNKSRMVDLVDSDRVTMVTINSSCII